MRISDLSSDVCSSDLDPHPLFGLQILVMGEEVLDLLEDDLGQVVLLTHLGVIREGRVDGHADQLLVAAMFVFEVEHRDRTRAHDAARYERRARDDQRDRKSTRLNTSHYCASRMQSSA